MLREGYEVTAAHEATHWWFRSRRELFLAQVEKAAHEVAPPGARLRLLDYGCGTGFNLPLLARFGEVMGAEIADEALTDFRRPGAWPILDLRHDEARLHHGRFDITVALDVLEHCDDDVTALRGMRRFLTRQGQMILTVPAYGWLWSGEDAISQHRRRYTRGTLAQACRAADLEIRYLSYYNLAILPGVAAVIWGRRLLRAEAPAHSNVGEVPRWLDSLLWTITSREARWVGSERLRLAAGAGLICRLRPSEDAVHDAPAVA